MWFWQHRVDGIAVINYEEYHSKPLSFYLDLLREQQYEYEDIWLPHDAKAKTLQTGRSTIEQILQYSREKQLDWSIKIIPKLDLQHGIDAVRFVLPHCYIDQQNCHEGIEALRAYKRRYDDLTKAFSPKPQHDWSSHGSDAFRGLAIVTKSRLKTPTVSEISRSFMSSGYTLEDLFAEREKVNWNRGRIHGS